MSLSRFNYLKKNRILILVLILTLTSTLFSVTALSFLSFYDGFNSYLGEKPDVIAIYDRGSRTPFTGLVPIYLAERMSTINGVIASSPEVIAPSIINDKSVFIRGIVPENFSKLDTLTIVAGAMITLNDTNLAVVGNALSERLNIKPGNNILVQSALSTEYTELMVKGVFDSQSSLDDEAIVPIYVAQWLRGPDYNHATLIRLKIDQTKITQSQIYDMLAKEATQSITPPSTGQQNPLEGIIPLQQLGFSLKDVGVQDAQTFMKNYLDRYGITKETLAALSVMVLVFASATAFYASTMFVDQHNREISILRSVGASRRKIKIDLLTKILPWSIVSSTLGIILAAGILAAFSSLGHLQVLSHTIQFHIDPLVVAANFALILLLVTICITRSGLKQ